jgi:peptidoglycan/LPS O-acetylase OafA/YrhL
MSVLRIRKVFGTWVLCAIGFYLVARFALLTHDDLAQPSWRLFRNHPKADFFIQLSLFPYIQLFALGINFFEVYVVKRINPVNLLFFGVTLLNEWLWSGLGAALVVALLSVLFYVAVILKWSIFRNPVLGYLGAISYSLYLLHQNFGYTIIRAFYKNGLSPVLGVVTSIGLLIVLATLLHHFVEKPSLKFYRSHLKSTKPVSPETAVPV